MENTVKKVLVLEPHPTAARMLGMMMAGIEGLEMVRVRSVQEAEAVSHWWNFDVLMSFFGGEELDSVSELLRLKRVAAGRPLVALNGVAKDSALFAFQAGAAAVLERSSLSAQRLKEVLNGVCAGRPQLEMLAAA